MIPTGIEMTAAPPVTMSVPMTRSVVFVSNFIVQRY